jgi:hypothetical protein
LVLLANKLVQSHAAATVRALTANPDRRFRLGVPGMSGSSGPATIDRVTDTTRLLAVDKDSGTAAIAGRTKAVGRGMWDRREGHTHRLAGRQECHSRTQQWIWQWQA